jgi:hypothetical protein
MSIMKSLDVIGWDAGVKKRELFDCAAQESRLDISGRPIPG